MSGCSCGYESVREPFHAKIDEDSCEELTGNGCGEGDGGKQASEGETGQVQGGGRTGFRCE